MPDIKTALQNALQTTIKQWDEPKQEQTQVTTHPNLNVERTPKGVRFVPTTDVTRATFNYVQAHPGMQNGEIAKALQQQGFNRNSVTSLLGQMAVVGHMRREDGRYFTAIPEYKPFSRSVVKSYLAKKKAAKSVAQTRAMKNYAPKVEPKPEPVAAAPVAAPVKVVNSVEELIDTLTIAQARDLFARLKKMFA